MLVVQAYMESLGLVGILKNLCLLTGEYLFGDSSHTGAGQALHTQCCPFTFSCGKSDKQWGGGHSENKNVGLPGTHPTKVAKALQDLLVKEAGLGWVCQGLV